MPRTKPASVLPTPEANWPKAPALQVCCVFFYLEGKWRQEAEREESEYLFSHFVDAALFSFLLLFSSFSTPPKKTNQNSYRVRPEQHLPGEAVALLCQRDVADACFMFFCVFWSRIRDGEHESRSELFSSSKKPEKVKKIIIFFLSLSFSPL